MLHSVHQINHLDLGQKIGLKLMVSNVERIIPKAKFNFKVKMLKLTLCDYSDTYIMVKGTILVENTATASTSAKK